MPEIDALPLIKRGPGEGFTLTPPANEITLRHLLEHTSGLSDHSVPLISEYYASDCTKPEFDDDVDLLVKNNSIPLLFEPGEGFAYGCSIRWTQLLIKRLAGRFVTYVQENVFDPLGMASSTYLPRDNLEIWDRRLQMTERKGTRLVADDDTTQGLTCSVSDVGLILSDLVSPSSRLLTRANTALLFTSSFAPTSTALQDLRSNDDNYRFCAGALATSPPAVNWSPLGGLMVEDELALSRMPSGTVTWEGWPNPVWAVNREKGLAVFFAVQVVPCGDVSANGLVVEFMRGAWGVFG
jgi:CubicO group peptidase (beta-lactamase class C family)